MEELLKTQILRMNMSFILSLKSLGTGAKDYPNIHIKVGYLGNNKFAASIKHETCLEYFRRRLNEGWKCTKFEGYNAILLSPDSLRRELDLRNDVETLRPNAAGAITTLARFPNTGEANWENVGEIDTDEDDTYNYQPVEDSYNDDYYNLQNHSIGSGTINKVTVYARCRSNGGSDETLNLLLYISETRYWGALGPFTLTTSYVTYSEEWATNPATGQPWGSDWNVIDALQACIELYRLLNDPRCTQVYVEVDYIPAGPCTIHVSWTKGAGAEKTMVRRKEDSYPTSPFDGIQVYFDTGNNFDDSGLLEDKHFFYRAWSYKEGAPNDGYSDEYAEDDEWTTAPPEEVTQYLAGHDLPEFPHEMDFMSDKLPCPPPY